MLCEELLSQHNQALGVIAFDWAYCVRKQYNAKTYGIFFRWLKRYVRGWSDCDDFCTHAFGELLKSRKELFASILEWTIDNFPFAGEKSGSGRPQRKSEKSFSKSG